MLWGWYRKPDNTDNNFCVRSLKIAIDTWMINSHSSSQPRWRAYQWKWRNREEIKNPERFILWKIATRKQGKNDHLQKEKKNPNLMVVCAILLKEIFQWNWPKSFQKLWKITCTTQVIFIFKIYGKPKYPGLQYNVDREMTHQSFDFMLYSLIKLCKVRNSTFTTHDFRNYANPY